MKHVIYLLTGILFVILTSATTVSVMTVKPAVPKEVFTYEFQSYGELQNVIHKKHKEGFIVKFATVKYSGILIMEKY